MEVIREVWPEENPFVTGRTEILEQVKSDLGSAERDYHFHALSDADAVFRFNVRAASKRDRPRGAMGISTLLAAWNAATYVAQIEDDRLARAMAHDQYLQATREVLLRNGGLWFNDELFVISRRPTLG